MDDTPSYNVRPRGMIEQKDKLRRELVRSVHLSPLAIVIVDATSADYPIISANRAFEELTGFSEDDLLGHNCRILLGPDTSSTARVELKRAISEGTPAFVTLTNYRKDGTPFLNAVMLAPVFDDAGTLGFFVGTQMTVKKPFPTEGTAQARLACLTRQQKRVLEQMARGLRHADIAAQMGLSIKTIKMHRGALVKRLGVVTSAEAIRIAVVAGL